MNMGACWGLLPDNPQTLYYSCLPIFDQGIMKQRCQFQSISMPWEAKSVKDPTKDVRRSNIDERNFLTNDGAEGKTIFERARSASRISREGLDG